MERGNNWKSPNEIKGDSMDPLTPSRRFGWGGTLPEEEEASKATTPKQVETPKRSPLGEEARKALLYMDLAERVLHVLNRNTLNDKEKILLAKALIQEIRDQEK